MEQTRTSTRETLELKKVKPMDFFVSYTITTRKDKWMLRLTTFENFGSVFNLGKEKNQYN